jgi:peroxiredoxin
MVPSVLAGEPSKSTAAAAAGVKIGAKAPDFTLKDTTGKEFNLSKLTGEGKIVVLEWFNSECPFCVKHGEAKTIVNLVNEFKDKNVVVLGINSGGPGKQGFGKDAEAIKAWGLNYPILIDSDGKVGRMFAAKTTPHMFVIHKDGTLVYQGAIDSEPGRTVGEPGKTTNYVRQALNEILASQTVSQPETKPYGCSVKYAN